MVGIYADGCIDSSPLQDIKKKAYNFELSLKGSDKGHLDKFNMFMGHIDTDHVTLSNTVCSNNGKIC